MRVFDPGLSARPFVADTGGNVSDAIGTAACVVAFVSR